LIIFEIVKRTESDSGVVIKISGGLLVIFFLFFADVSPCLISIVKFSSSAYRTILLSTSLFNALNGVTYIALIPFSFLFNEISFIMGTIAASVFPDPVGATKRES